MSGIYFTLEQRRLDNHCLTIVFLKCKAGKYHDTSVYSGIEFYLLTLLND